jgi:hypothetical protein
MQTLSLGSATSVNELNKAAVCCQQPLYPPLLYANELFYRRECNRVAAPGVVLDGILHCVASRHGMQCSTDAGLRYTTDKPDTVNAMRSRYAHNSADGNHRVAEAAATAIIVQRLTIDCQSIIRQKRRRHRSYQCRTE